ncbi:hypothetical protein PAAL109150_22350 [Paenibacillus alkaliterrae]
MAFSQAIMCRGHHERHLVARTGQKKSDKTSSYISCAKMNSLHRPVNDLLGDAYQLARCHLVKIDIRQ